MKKILLSASAAALLLGSCSKDSAELAPAVKDGETAFIASMTIGNADETRVSLDHDADTDSYDYMWDAGDMIGASTGNTSENVPFISKTQGDKAEFNAVDSDLEYLGGEGKTFYMVYPYDKNTKIEELNVKMEIPEVQRYRENSFAPMSTPAVAVVDGYKKGQTIQFLPVASYIRIPVRGVGIIKKLTMEWTSSDGEKIDLSGAGSVDLTADELIFNLEEKPSKQGVTIDFGKQDIELNYTSTKNLIFIIPANISLNGTVLDFTATMKDGSEASAQIKLPTKDVKTIRNKVLANDELLTVTLGLEDKTLITSVDEFLRYVYSVNKFAVDAAEVSDLVWENEGTKEYKTALIINNELDCSTIRDQMISDPSDAMYDAYVWYLRDNGGNFMFPADKAFKLAGVDPKNPVTIMDMNVKTSGDGIFENNADALLENIIIKDAVVTVDNDELNNAVAKFLADDNTASFTNVKVEGGEIKAAAGPTLTKAALVGSVKASELEQNKNLVKEGAYPRCGEKAILVAESLNIDGDVDLTSYVADAPKFGEIVGAFKGAKITIVGDVTEKDVEDSIMAVINAGKTTNDNYFSVMMESGQNVTSLWTGLKGEYKNGKQITTAEDLAAAVETSQTEDVKFSFMSNIDLRNLDWVAGGEHKTTIDGNGRTLKNVRITNYTTGENDEKVITSNWFNVVRYVSVFGKEANITALNVDELTIDIIGEESENTEDLKDIYVGGLAYQGVATYVNLTGATIDVADDVKLAKESDGKSYIGAVMSISKDSSLNATVNASATINGVAAEGAFGKINK